MNVQLTTDTKMDYGKIALICGAAILVISVGVFIGIWSAQKAAA